MQEKVKSIRKLRKENRCKKGYTTLVLHSNMMEEKDFEVLDRQLKEHREKFISYDEYLKVNADKRGLSGHVIEYMMALSKYILVRLRNR